MRRKYVNDSHVKLAKVAHPEKDVKEIGSVKHVIRASQGNRVKQRMGEVRGKGLKPGNHVGSAIHRGISIKRNRVGHAMIGSQRKIGRDGKFVSRVNPRASIKKIKHSHLHNKTVPEFSGAVLFVSSPQAANGL
jgi:hypothetical protein